MKAVLWLLVLSLAGLFVLAVVFRSQQARDALRFIRNAIWIYIAVVFALALLQVYREGF